MSDRIQISCGKCNKRMAVPAKYAGKRIKCPSCEVALAIPAAKASSRPERASSTPKSSARPASPAAKSKTPTTKSASATAKARKTSAKSASAPKGAVVASATKKKRKAAPKKAAETYDDDWLNDDSGFSDDGDLYGDDYGSYDDYDAPALPPKAKKKKKKSAKPKLRGSGNEAPRAARRPTMSFGDRMMSGGGLKGLGMIVVSVIWFFAGLAAGYIYFYPPVMFCIGLYMFGSALFGGSSYE